MAKLSEAMIRGLRAFSMLPGAAVPARTVKALQSRFLIVDVPSGYRITPAGEYELSRIEREAKAKAHQAERLSRPVPAGAFVEPSAKRAPVLDHEYEDDYEADPAAYERAVEQHAGPSVRLTPAPADAKREATDAEVLQLCAMLDAGVRVTRSLYQEYTVVGHGSWTLNLEAVNRAARDAVRFGLVRQAFADRHYVLTAEPIHLDTGTGMTGCGVAQSYSTIRRRWTTDPDKVTHERCKR